MEIIARSPETLLIPGMLCWADQSLAGKSRLVKLDELFIHEDTPPPPKGKRRKTVRYHRVLREVGEACFVPHDGLKPVFLKPDQYPISTQRFAEEVEAWDLKLGQRILIARLPLYLLTGHRESLTIGRVAVIRPMEYRLVVYTSAFIKGPETAHELLLLVRPEEIRTYTAEEMSVLQDERHKYFEEAILREDLEADLANYPGLNLEEYRGQLPPE